MASFAIAWDGTPWAVYLHENVYAGKAIRFQTPEMRDAWVSLAPENRTACTPEEAHEIGIMDYSEWVASSPRLF